jgi:hypothetical protein
MKRFVLILATIVTGLAVATSATAFEVEENSIDNRLVVNLWNKDPSFPLDIVTVSVSQPSFVTSISPLVTPISIPPLSSGLARFSFDVGPVDSGVAEPVLITVDGDVAGMPVSSTKAILIEVVVDAPGVQGSPIVPGFGLIGLVVCGLAVVGLARFQGQPRAATSTAVALLLLVAAPVRAGQPTEITIVMEVQPAPDLLTAFAGSDADQADAAFFLLFEQEELAIDGLLSLTENFDEYAGNGFYDPRSSLRRVEFTPVALMAIYAVEAILRGNPIPHLAPMLRQQGGTISEPISQAIQAYNDWWLINQGQPLPILQAIPGPLDGLLFGWAGPLLAVAVDAGTGTEVPNTSTPLRTIGGRAVCLDNPGAQAYSWEFLSPPASATPYNCLAWAIACHTDRWSQPSGKAGEKLDDILDDAGYDETTPVACAGQCPNGKGPKVKLIFHKGAGEAANEGNWVHAMKQEADGDWSSKNGASSRYKDITDCTKFLDKHYKTPATKTRELKCYCK